MSPTQPPEPEATGTARPADAAASVPEAAGTAAAAQSMPQPQVSQQNRSRLSLVWIVPIVALVIGVVLVLRAVLQAGPELQIEFRSAEGIEPGRTEVRFKEVVIGRVKRVQIRPDREKIIAIVALEKSAENIAVFDTRFWVVRPRIGSAGISGLGTLVSGAYIGVDAGESTDARRAFIGLDNPPLVLRGEPGRSFVLQADDLGSLDVGSPVYHRRVRVGRVVGYALDSSGKSLEVQVFIEAPFEQLVTRQSRFWNASGVDLALNAGGLTVNTQSVASVLAGGLAFAQAADAASAAAATPGQRFRLFSTQRAAMAADDGEPLRVRMVFDQSLRGLDAGAPIDLLGVEIGTVRGIALHPEAAARRLPMEVMADIYPMRLGRLRDVFGKPGTSTQRSDKALLKQLVDNGLRAQVRNGNLLTGSLYIALEFVPKAQPAALDMTAAVPTLPSVPGTLSDVQPQLAEIVSRLSKVRFDEIGGDLQQALKAVNGSGASLQSALGSAEALMRTLTPEAQTTLADLRKTLASAQQTLAAAQQTLGSAERGLLDPQAPLQRSAGQTLAELQRAAQAMRVLADYLQRHPEAILRGKPGDPDLVRGLEGSK